MTSPAKHSGACCPVLELRRYVMQPGGFDRLLSLFEATFIREQEAVGMHLVGFFHQLDDPLRFVWIRGFDGMAQRHAAYAGFYGSQLWRDLRDATNATLVDSSDVLLLRPIDGRGFARGPMPGPESGQRGSGRIVTTLLFLGSPVDPPTRQAFVEAFGGTRLEVIALLESETAPNTWTRHPVREGEHLLAGFCWVDMPQVEQALGRLDAALAALRARGARTIEHLVLRPAACSRLR